MSSSRNAVIVLEDDATARAALCLLLSDWDFSPIPAISAAEALAALNGAKGDVVAVITDFDLGRGSDGVAESRALIEAGLSVPVLVISASLSGHAGEAARVAGFQFLPKPVTPVNIQRWLDGALGKAA